MCFGGGGNDDTPQPQKPAQVLQQAAPEKKTAVNNSGSVAPVAGSKSLSIGSKRYRTEQGTKNYRSAPSPYSSTRTSGLGSTTTSSSNSPAGHAVAM